MGAGSAVRANSRRSAGQVHEGVSLIRLRKRFDLGAPPVAFRRRATPRFLAPARKANGQPCNRWLHGCPDLTFSPRPCVFTGGISGTPSPSAIPRPSGRLCASHEFSEEGGPAFVQIRVINLAKPSFTGKSLLGYLLNETWPSM